MKAEAVFDKGVEELLDVIEQHRQYIEKVGGGLHFRRQKGKVRQELGEMVKNRLIKGVLEHLTETGAFDRAVDAIVRGETDPYSACDELVIPALRSCSE